MPIGKEITLTCPHCGLPDSFVESDFERMYRCPRCREWFTTSEGKQRHNTSSVDHVSNIDLHTKITNELHEGYIAKNADYGDSFSKLYKEFGLTSTTIRLSDKVNRLKTLCKQEAKVKNESVRDTLLDIANYSILTVMEIDAMEGETK